MAPTFSISQAIARMAEMTIAVKAAEHEAMKCAALIVEAEAKREIGEYQAQAGQFVAWAELADSTKADRVKQGYGENDPGLRSGAMRADIDHAVSEPGAATPEAVVGSNDDKLVWFELGTSKQPPRSVLGGAAIRKGEDVAKVIGGTIVKALVGDQVFNGNLPIP